MNVKQYSFSEMARKMVVNMADGSQLGHVCDLIFSSCGRVLGLVVPGVKRGFFKTMASCENQFIPWNRIIKIGSDVVLVELCGMCASTFGEAETLATEQNSNQNCYDSEK